MDDTALTICLLISYVVLYQYGFRFQRTTLGIARSITQKADMESLLAVTIGSSGLRRRTGQRNLQIAMTPGWVGAVGWLQQVVLLVTAFMVWRTWGWVPLAGFALYAFALGSLVDTISPLPSYGHCFRLIERVVERDGESRLLNAVRRVRNEHGIRIQ